MKACTKCAVMKPMADFHCDNSMKDGRYSRCRVCRRKTKEVSSEQNRRYASSTRGKATRAALAKKYQARNPVKHAARRAVHTEIRAGRIVRQSCEVCGVPSAQAHHDDYNKPLDVRWLCRVHHQEWHEQNTPIYPEQEQSAA